MTLTDHRTAVTEALDTMGHSELAHHLDAFERDMTRLGMNTKITLAVNTEALRVTLVVKTPAANDAPLFDGAFPHPSADQWRPEGRYPPSRGTLGGALDPVETDDDGA